MPFATSPIANPTAHAATIPGIDSRLGDLWGSIQKLLAAGRRHDAIVTLRAVANSTGCLDIRVTLGTVLAEGGDYPAAIAEWVRVIDAARVEANTKLLAAAYHNLAAASRECGDDMQAAIFQRQALNFQADCGTEDLLQLANIALTQSQLDWAESLLETAFASQLSDCRTLDWDLIATRGVLRGLQGDHVAACADFRAAYHGHRARNDATAAAKDLLNLAAVLEAQQRPVLAACCLRQLEQQPSLAQSPLLRERHQAASERLHRTQQRRQFRSSNWN